MSTSPAHLRKTLTWKDGFWIAMSIPPALFSAFGYALGVVNAWTAIAIWLLGTVIGWLQTYVFAEMASMFPTSSGGITRYAIEGWKKYFAPLGAIAAFGYWLGWSLTISLSAVVLGELLTASFFPDLTWSFQVFGNELGLPHVLAAIAMIGAWALNYFGVKIGASINKILGVVLLAGLGIVVISCFASPNVSFDTSRLNWGFEGDWRTLVVVFYTTAWATYGTEICATFAPEYKNTAKDTSRAMRYSALMVIAVFFIVPFSVAGAIGEQAIADNPVTYLVVALNTTLGSFGWIGSIFIAAAMIIVIISATADGGRALYGLAQEGMTLKQFDWLNRWGVPGRSLTVDLIINLIVMFLVGSPVAILLASNFGYLLAVILSLAAFLLLRKDRPGWPRPIKRARAWIPLTAFLVALNLFVLIVGFLNPSLLGYGGIRESIVAVVIMLMAVVLYVIRVVAQDKKRLTWRVPSPSLPEGEEKDVLESEMRGASDIRERSRVLEK